MAKKKDYEVVEWFEKLHKEKALYLWGANGEVINKSLIDKLYKTFKSTKYDYDYYYNWKLKEGKGKYGCDCSGAFFPMRGKDLTAKGYYNECKDKGKIAKMPMNKVCLLWNKNLTHIGLYCGNNGYTIEMKSSNDNCVKQKFQQSRWYYYGCPDWIEYSNDLDNDLYYYIVKGDTLYKLSKRYGLTVAELKLMNNLKSNTIYVGDKLKIKDDWVARLQKVIGAKVDNVAGKETLSKTPTIKKGVKGEVVKLLQERLQNKYGISVGKSGFDSSCGGDTVRAINEFQLKCTGLRVPDGEFTAKGLSWQTILGLR